MIKKSFPIKEPYFYDTKKGVDHFTKVLLEEGQKKLSEKEKQQIHNLGKDMKKAALGHHIRNVQPFDSFNKETYPSRPEVRGRLMEIERLEKDLAPPKLVNLPIVKNNINNIPVKRRNYFDDTVKLNVGNKGPIKLPKLTPEEIKRANEPDLWEDVIYKSMSPFEKGQWNAEQRKNKLQRQKEIEKEKRQNRAFSHLKQQWGLNTKENEGIKYVGSRQHLYDEKEEKTKEPLSTPEKPMEHFVLPSQRVTPVLPPEETPSLDQRLRNTKIAAGLSPELLGLQKQIRRNVNYVLGADQKEESRNEKATTKEETYD